MSRKKQYRLTVAFCKNDKIRLVDFAKEGKTTPSLVIREALKAYLSNQQNHKISEVESILEQRMRQLEDRLAAIMVKLTRAAAQNLFFVTLPFTKGGWPSNPLSTKAFNHLWNESRQFASEWLKKAKISPVEDGGDIT